MTITTDIIYGGYQFQCAVRIMEVGVLTDGARQIGPRRVVRMAELARGARNAASISQIVSLETTITVHCVSEFLGTGAGGGGGGGGHLLIIMML